MFGKMLSKSLQSFCQHGFNIGQHFLAQQHKRLFGAAGRNAGAMNVFAGEEPLLDRACCGEGVAEEMRAGGANVNGATRKSIECEFADCNTVVLMVGMMTSPIDWENMRLWVRETRLRHRRKPLKPAMPVGQTPAVRRMSIREAVFADSGVALLAIFNAMRINRLIKHS